MTPYISRTDFKAISAKVKAKEARRAEKVAESASIADAVAGKPVCDCVNQEERDSCPQSFGHYHCPVHCGFCFPKAPTASQEPRGGLRTPVRGSGQRKRKKSPSLTKLKKTLWDETSLLVRSWSPVCLSCLVQPTECAAHIVPSNEGAITRYFLPNLYPCCFDCNGLEKWNRATWVFHHRERFGEDYVDALYAMADGERKKPIAEKFQVKKYWVLEQTERVKKLRGTNGKNSN